MSAVRRAAIAAGAVGGVAGLTWAAQRLAAARACGSGPMGLPPASLDAPIYVDHRIDTHDRGSHLCRRERCEHAIRRSCCRTASRCRCARGSTNSKLSPRPGSER